MRLNFTVTCFLTSCLFLLCLFPGHGLAAEKREAKGVSFTQTTCEWQINPQGIDIPFPRLGWCIRGDSGLVAYQVIVSPKLSDIAAGKGRMWNSGIVHSARDRSVVYGGRRLKSGVRYYWSVRVFDARGVASAWSVPAWFETLFFSPKEWSV